jgi:hypothetical protein
MHHIYFLFIFILIACNNETSDKNISIKKDSLFVQKTDSSLVKPPISFSKTYDGKNFLFPVQFHDSIEVQKIQQIVAKIEKTKFKDSVHLENEEFMENMTDGGGSLTGYFDNNKLVRIAEWYGLSWGISQVDYYLSNDDLVLVIETEQHFDIDKNMNVDHSRFGQLFRGDYYFNKGKLFDEVSMGHNRFEDSANNPETEYIRRAKENKKIILKHKTH